MIEASIYSAFFWLIAATVPCFLAGYYCWQFYKKVRQRDDVIFLKQISKSARSDFCERVQKSINEAELTGENCAIVYINFDNFKHLNDRLGHEIGDKLIMAVAARLCKEKGNENYIKWLGSDEFALLLPNLDRNKEAAIRSAIIVGGKLRDAVGENYTIGDLQVQITSSIGIFVFDSTVENSSHALRCSETAMLDAKVSGRNKVRVFEDVMLEEIEQTTALITDLRDAIENCELELKYQPQVDRNGRVIGAEALIRWNHRTKGNISPDRFIPIAEESGLIAPMTDWVMEQALDTLVRWQRHPQLANLSLSVNVSAPQIHEKGFLERVQHYVQHYPIDMSRLVVEITERVFIGELDVARKVMKGLQDLDIRFSLDDYGTGFSSLSQLRGLQFDELKIDGTFVRELESNSNDRAIVRSTLVMAKALGLKCVAEWVETEEQFKFLCQEGCEYLQGFLFSPAVSLEEFEHLAVRKEFVLSTLNSQRPLFSQL